MNVIVKSIKRGKVKGKEKYWFVVGGGNISNYNLFIDDAIPSCEVVPCSKTIQAEKSSVADELIKLKSLLDAGAITQDEYEKQKKKILN